MLLTLSIEGCLILNNNMMNFEFIKPYIPEIITFVAGLSAWSYERNKRKQDLRKAETDNNKSIMDLYQEALNDLKARYDSDLKELEIKHRENIKELESKYDAKFKEIEGRYNRLKKAFEDYKLKHK